MAEGRHGGGELQDTVLLSMEGQCLNLLEVLFLR